MLRTSKNQNSVSAIILAAVVFLSTTALWAEETPRSPEIPAATALSSENETGKIVSSNFDSPVEGESSIPVPSLTSNPSKKEEAAPPSASKDFNDSKETKPVKKGSSGKGKEKDPVRPSVMLKGKKGFSYDRTANYSEEISGTVVTVMPEIATHLFLSSSDVNRVVCNEGPVKDVIFSQEKGLLTKIVGNSVFVKYQAAQDSISSEITYAKVPTEIYIVCGDDSVYTMIATPKVMPPQTVQLSKGEEEKIKKNLALFEGQPLERKVNTIIKAAYRDEVADSFEVLPEKGKRVKVAFDRKQTADSVFNFINISMRRTIVVPGEGLELREFVLTKKDNVEGNVQLHEKFFLKPEFGMRPVAISLSKHMVADEPVRLFVVQKKNEE
jgi:conjugal transfer pilus assembly protein TraK